MVSNIPEKVGLKVKDELISNKESLNYKNENGEDKIEKKELEKE